jgi:hypothetical protein
MQSIPESVTKIFNAAQTAFNDTQKELQREYSGVYDREALKVNTEHASNRLFGENGFVERTRKLSSTPDQMLTLAQAERKIVNIDEPDRTASTKLQKAYLDGFMQALETAKTAPIASRPAAANEDDFATTVRDTLAESPDKPNNRNPIIDRKNIEAALGKALDEFLAVTALREKGFMDKNKDMDPDEVAAEFKTRLSKTMDFLLDANTGVATRLQKLQSTKQIKLVLDSARNEIPKHSKTMRPAIEAYFDKFVEVLADLQPNYADSVGHAHMAR